MQERLIDRVVRRAPWERGSDIEPLITREWLVTNGLGGYTSSPVAAEGKILIASEEGKVTVLKAGAAWEVMQINDLEEGCYATPALADGSIYLRTNDALYRFAMTR